MILGDRSLAFADEVELEKFRDISTPSVLFSQLECSVGPVVPQNILEIEPLEFQECGLKISQVIEKVKLHHSWVFCLVQFPKFDS